MPGCLLPWGSEWIRNRVDVMFALCLFHDLFGRRHLWIEHTVDLGLRMCARTIEHDCLVLDPQLSSTKEVREEATREHHPDAIANLL